MQSTRRSPTRPRPATRRCGTQRRARPPDRERQRAHVERRPLRGPLLFDVVLFDMVVIGHDACLPSASSRMVIKMRASGASTIRGYGQYISSSVDESDLDAGGQARAHIRRPKLSVAADLARHDRELTPTGCNRRGERQSDRSPRGLSQTRLLTGMPCVDDASFALGNEAHIAQIRHHIATPRCRVDRYGLPGCGRICTAV